MMEFKRRSKSSNNFLIAHSKSMHRLKSLSKFNGVLENIRLNTPAKDKDKNKDKNKDKDNQDKMPIFANKNDKKQRKLPVIRKILKLNTLSEVKNHIPSEGYLQFETNEINKNGQIVSTISSNGVILCEKNVICFLNMKQLEDRQAKIKKLRQIEIFKYMNILKPFLKWKKYSKVKRFAHLRISVKNKLNIHILKQRLIVHSRLIDYFQTNLFSFSGYLLSCVNIAVSDNNISRKINFRDYFIYLLTDGWQNIIQQLSSKGSLSLLSDLQTFSKVCLCSYRILCKQYAIKMVQQIQEGIIKHFNSYMYGQEQYKKILEGLKFQIFSHLICNEITVQYNNSNEIKFDHKPSLFFTLTKDSKINIDLQDQIYNLIRNNKNPSQFHLKQNPRFNMKSLIEKLDFTWLQTDQQLGNKFAELNLTLHNIWRLNSENCQNFIELIKKLLDEIADSSLFTYKKIHQIQNKLQKIKYLPDTVYCGMLSFNFKPAKKKLNKRINKFLQQQCQKLPKDIDSILKKQEQQAEHLNKRIQAGICSIQAFVSLTRDINKFSQWKQISQERTKQVQSTLSILSKINPRICQPFNVRFIQLKQKIHEMSIKSKTLQKSLPSRVKHVSCQKKKLIISTEQKIREVKKQIAELRAGRLSEMQYKIQKIHKKLYELKIKDILQILEEFIQIQKSLEQKKQLEYIKKIKQSCNNCTKQINLYYRLLKQRQVTQKNINKFLGITRYLKTTQMKNHEKFIEVIKEKIQKQKKLIQQQCIQINHLLSAHIQHLNSYLQFFRFIAIINKSSSYQDDTKYSHKTIEQIFQNRQNMNYKQQLNLIEEQMNIIENYKIQFKNTQCKMRQNKIFLSSEIKGADQSFLSIQNTIQIFNQAIIIQNNKIDNVATLLHDNFKNFLKEDISKTLQNLRNFQDVVVQLRRMEDLRRMYNKKKQIIQSKLPQTLQKVEQKWQTLFNHFEQCLVIDFMKKIKNFQKMLGEVGQIQIQAQQKIQFLLTRAYSTFPLFNLLQKNIVIKSILDPIFFLKYFFHNYEIKNQNNGITISSKYGQKIRLLLPQCQINIHKCFSQIEKKIKNKMLEISLAMENSYNFMDFLTQEYQGTPIQIISFIDLIKLGQNIQHQIRNQKNQKQIEQLTKTIQSIGKNRNISHNSITYARKLISTLIMNRLEIRQLFGNSSLIFYPSYQFNKQESQFYFNICHTRVRIAYQLADIQKNMPLTNYQELYLLANIHQSICNPSSTIILKDSSIIDIYSFRTMRYYFKFPLLHNRLHPLIYSALRSKTIINLEHREPLSEELYGAVYDELFKIYNERKQKFNQLNNQNQNNFSWPIFVTLSSDIKYLQINAQRRYFFRNLTPISPHSGLLFEWIIRQQINSTFSSFFLKFSSDSDLLSKNNRYIEMKRILLKFSKVANKYNKSKLKPFISTYILRKILQKLRKNTESNQSKCKLKYSKFLKLIRYQLFTFLIGNNLQQLHTINKFQLSNKSVSFFQLNSTFSLGRKQQDTIQVLQTGKIINNSDIKSKEQELDPQDQDYYVQKAHQFCQALKSSVMVVLLGGCYSGKSYFIKNYYKQKIQLGLSVCNLHPKALGKQLWQQKNSIFQDKSHQNNRHILIFEGDLSENNYLYFEKMLECKQLYYESGQKIPINPKSQIIFQAQNTHNIDPYIYIQLHWVHLKQQQLSWSVILISKINTLMEKTKTEFNGQDISQNNYLIEQLFVNLEQQSQRMFTQILSNEDYKAFFRHYSDCKCLIVKVFRLLDILCPFDDLKRVNFFKYNENEKIQPKFEILFQIFCYCLLLQIEFSQIDKQNYRIVEKLKGFIRKKSHIEVDKPCEKLLRVEQTNEKKIIKFQLPNQTTYQHYCVYSSFKMIPNYKIAITSYIANLMIQNGLNILVLGKQCSGKSSFIRNLPSHKKMQNFVMIFPQSFAKIVSKIKQKSLLNKKTYGKGQINRETDQNIIILIEDCALDIAQNKDLGSKLKYLWQKKQFIEGNQLIKENYLSFVIELTSRSNYNIPKQFRHLNSVHIEAISQFEVIFNYFSHSFQDICPIRSIPKQIISQFEHSQINYLLKILQDLKRAFSPVKIEDWKHKYSGSFITESILILKNFISNNKIHFVQDSNNQQAQKQVEYKLMEGIKLLTLKLISFRLTKQQLIIFNSLIKSKQNLQQKFQQYFSHALSWPSAKNIKSKQNSKESNQIKNCKLIQAIQLRTCVLVEYQYNVNIGSEAQYILKQNKNFIMIQVSKNLTNYKNFLTFIQQKYRSCSRQNNKKKVIFFYTRSMIKQNNFFILDCIKQFIRCSQDNRQFIPPADINFVVEYQRDNIDFVNKMLQLTYLQRKSTIVTLQKQFYLNIEMYLTKQNKQKIQQMDSSQKLITQLHKVLEYLQLEAQKSQSIKNTPHNHFIITPLTQDQIENLIQKIVSIYDSYIKTIYMKENILQNAAFQLQKLSYTHQQMGKKLGNLSLQLRSLESQLHKTRQSLSQNEQKFQIMMQQVKNTQYKEMMEKQQLTNPKKIQKQRKRLKKQFKQVLASITRTQVSQLKYIVINNRDLYSDLYEGICLALTGEYDSTMIDRISMDVNLVMKIRQCKFNLRQSPCLEMIIEKTSQAFKKMQQKHILRKITEWAFYGATLELVTRSLENGKKQLSANIMEKLMKQKGKIYENGKMLEDIAIAIEKDRQQLLQTQLKIDQITFELDESRQLKLKLKDFQIFADMGAFIECQREKLKIDKQNAIFNTIYCIFCYQLLPNLSSLQLMETKNTIISAICLNQPSLNQQYFKNQNWYKLYSKLTQTQEIGKKNLLDQTGKMENIPEQPTKMNNQNIITGHQIMKLTYLFEKIKNKKKILVINRQGIFEQVIKQFSGNIPSKQQDHTSQFSDILCNAIEIQQQQWSIIKQKHQTTTTINSNINKINININNKNNSINKQKQNKLSSTYIRLNNQKYPQREFYITNSLGQIDLRICNKPQVQQMTVVDFGIDSRDMQQIVQNEIKKIQKIPQQNTYSLKRQKLIIKNLYTLSQEIADDLPNICLCKSHINEINQHARRIKKQLRSSTQYINQIKYQTKHNRMLKQPLTQTKKISSQQQYGRKINKQLSQLYSSFEYCHRLVLQSSQIKLNNKNSCISKLKQELPLINLPQKYFHTCLKIFRQHIQKTLHLQKQLIVEIIKNIFIMKLFYQLPLSPRQEQFEEKNNIIDRYDISFVSPELRSQGSLQSSNLSISCPSTSQQKIQKKVVIKQSYMKISISKFRDSSIKQQQVHKFCRYFRVVYFFYNHCCKYYNNVSMKDVENIFNFPFLDHKLKKLLQYRGVDAQLINFNHKNFKIETHGKAILQMIRKPDQYGFIQDKLTQQIIFNRINKIKQLNYLQKLSIAKIFCPTSFTDTIHSQIIKMIQDMDKKLKVLTKNRIYLQYEQFTQDRNALNNNISVSNIASKSNIISRGKKQVNLLICVCDLNFWSVIFKQELNNYDYYINKSGHELNPNISKIKFYCFSSLIKMPQSIFYSRELKVILVMNNPIQQQSIKNQVLHYKISFTYISIEKLLQTLWNQLIKNKKIYQIFEELQPQLKSRPHTERYLQYRKFLTQYTGIYEKIQQNNEFQQQDKTSLQILSSDANLRKSLRESQNSILQNMVTNLNIHKNRKNKKRSKKFSLIDSCQYSQDVLLLSKKVYIGLRRAEIQQNQDQIQNQIQTIQNSMGYIEQFFQILEIRTHNLKITNIRPLAQELREKLSEITAIPTKCQQKQLPILKKYISTLYDNIKQNFLSQNLSHQELVLRCTSNKLQQLNGLVHELYEALYLFCRFKGGSVDYLGSQNIWMGSKTSKSLKQIQILMGVSGQLNISSGILRSDSCNKFN